MKDRALLGITLLVVGCHAASDEHRPVVRMQPHEGDHLWSFHESKDEIASGGELQIFIDPETHPEAWASFAKYTLAVGGALPGSPPLSLVFTTVPNEKQGLLAFFRRISVRPGQEPIALSPEELASIASEPDLILRAPEAHENQKARRALPHPPQ